MVYRAPTLCLFVSGAADVSQSAIVSLLLFPLLCWLCTVYSAHLQIFCLVNETVPRAPRYYFK